MATLFLNMILWALVALLVMYAAAVGYMYLRQRAILYAPTTARPDRAACGVEDMQEVVLSTEDGLILNAWWLPPRPGRPAVVYCHGNAGNMADCAFKVAAYRAAGMGVLLFDYRGYGGNPGTPTEQGLYADARAARSFVLAQGVADEALVIHGESLGSGVAAHLALEHRPAALIMEAAFVSIPAVGKREYPWLPVHRLTKDRFESLAKIGRIHCPVFFLHGKDDDLVPVDMAQTLHAHANDPKRLHIFPGALHANLYDFGAGERITAWLDDVLGRAGDTVEQGFAAARQ